MCTGGEVGEKTFLKQEIPLHENIKIWRTKKAAGIWGGVEKHGVKCMKKMLVGIYYRDSECQTELGLHL